MAYENYVLTKLEEVGSRSALKCQLRDLWDYAIENVPFVESSWEDLLLPTLVQDGWVLFQDDKEVLISYLMEVDPGYDPKMGVDHPAWARSPAVTWP